MVHGAIKTMAPTCVREDQFRGPKAPTLPRPNCGAQGFLSQRVCTLQTGQGPYGALDQLRVCTFRLEKATNIKRLDPHHARPKHKPRTSLNTIHQGPKIRMCIICDAAQPSLIQDIEASLTGSTCPTRAAKLPPQNIGVGHAVPLGTHNSQVTEWAIVQVRQGLQPHLFW